jgi:hypothetical protein
MEKKRTLAEICKNPESMTDEEIKDVKEMMNAFAKLGKSLEPYNIEIQSNNTSSKLSKKFYQEHFIMSAILEAFLFKNEITFKELNESIVNHAPKEFIWNVTAAYQNLIIGKMIRLGLIVSVETENEYNPKFQITDDGISTYRQYTFQSLASSSFFNYQTHLLNKRANKMTILMFIVAIMSVIVTILSIIK